MQISQTDYEYFLKLTKEFESKDPILLGSERWVRNIISSITPDVFQLNFYRGYIEISKFTFNQSFRKSIVLIRYDSRGTHTNPDGTKFSGPHVHLYSEQYGDKIAHPVKVIGLSVSDPDTADVFKNLMTYFNVTTLPIVQTSLI